MYKLKLIFTIILILFIIWCINILKPIHHGCAADDLDSPIIDEAI